MASPEPAPGSTDRPESDARQGEVLTELAERLLVHRDEALGPRTTLGVGGPAPWVIEPRRREELLEAVTTLQRAGIPFRVLGHGSNLVVDDAGLPEVVLHTRLMQGIWHHGERDHALRVECGAPLTRLIGVAQRQGLAGVEALIGIPGTLGGAVVGNAGGRHGCLADVITAVTVVDPDGSAREIDVTADDFGYRCSPFKPGPGTPAPLQGRAILDAVLQLTPDSPAAIHARMSAVLQAKRDSQPLAARSAGCMFRNDAEVPAARLIDAAGCKGLAVGRAEVSRLHANFILNRGGATAADIAALVGEVRRRVRAHAGAELELEVESWGPPSGAGRGASGAGSRAP